MPADFRGGPLIQRKLLTLVSRIGMRRPCHCGECPGAEQGIGSGLAGLSEVNARVLIPDLVLGDSQFEQHERAISMCGWFIQRPTEQGRGGVRGSAAQCRSRCLPQHGHHISVATRRSCQEVHRDGSRISPVPVQQTSGTSMKVGSLDRGQIFIDRGANDGVYEAQGLPRNQHREVDEADGQTVGDVGIHTGQLCAHRKSRLFAKDRHRPSQGRCLRVKVTYA